MINMTTKPPAKSFISDFSLWALLFFNLITIYYAVTENWSLSEIMLIYWFQSITIGFFNIIRILQLKKFSTEGFKINGRQPDPTPATKVTVALFFLLHYGIFHLGYLVFIMSGTQGGAEAGNLNNLQWGSIAFGGLIFFINHLVSFYFNRVKDTKILNIGSLMFYPYARIIPMHLTVVLGAAFGNALVGFLLLKTLADVIMHRVEHAIFRAPDA